MVEIVVTNSSGGGTPLDWLPVVISAGAFIVALAALLYNTGARAVPTFDVFDQVNGDEVVAHGLNLYNTGRRALAVRRIGLVQDNGHLRYVQDDEGGAAAVNPDLPIIIEPGGVRVFVMPMLEDDRHRTEWTYRALCVRGRRRNGEPKVQSIEVTRKLAADLTVGIG